jgi:hypothetical protein
VVKENFVKRIVEFVILKRVRDIQQILNHPETAAVLFGKFHRQVNLQAHGKDFSAVVPPLSKPHIIKQKILNIDTNDLTVLEAMVQMLAEQIGFELRTRKQIPHSICVEIHYSDGIRNSGKGRGNFNDDKSLTALCLNLFSKANYRRNRIRSVLVDATNLQTVSQQLDLFDERQLTYDTLSKTIDKIRARFGESSIHSASALAS